MRYAVLALAAAALVRAQNTTLIPTNITSSCSTFLDSLNADTTLAACVQPLINATASFSPTSGANLSTEDINYTLASICKSTSGCSDSTIRTWLSSFYSSCQAELTGSTSYNSQVRELYDILYVVNPLQAAVCSIDSANQDYCVNEILGAKANSTSTASGSAASASASATTNGSLLVNSFAVSSWSPVNVAAENLYITMYSATTGLTKRLLSYVAARDAAQSVNMATIITPNTTTYRTTNLPYLFLQPSMSSSALCTPCTREIMVAYIKWESQQPYALGLSQSPILGGQSALWSAINSTCGTAYVNAITSEVGTFASSSNNSTSGADRTWGAPVAGAGLAFVAGAMALLV